MEVLIKTSHRSALSSSSSPGPPSPRTHSTKRMLGRSRCHPAGVCWRLPYSDENAQKDRNWEQDITSISSPSLWSVAALFNNLQTTGQTTWCHVNNYFEWYCSNSLTRLTLSLWVRWYRNWTNKALVSVRICPRSYRRWSKPCRPQRTETGLIPHTLI